MKKNLICKKKIISFVLLIILCFTSLGLILKPKGVSAAVGAEAETWNIYDFIDKITVAIAKSIFFQIVKVAKVRILTGQSDVPLFPADTLTYAEDAGIEAVRQQINAYTGYDICGAVGAGVTLAALSSLAMPDYEKPLIPSCTAKEQWERINKGEGSLSDFVSISSPENNFFGVYLIASNNIEEKKAEKKLGVTTDLVANEGYLGVKTCEKREAALKVCEKMQGPGAKDECIAKAPQCTTTIGGALVGKDIDRTKGAPLDQFNAANTWKEAGALFPSVLVDLTSATFEQWLYQEGVAKYNELKK